MHKICHNMNAHTLFARSIASGSSTARVDRRSRRSCIDLLRATRSACFSLLLLSTIHYNFMVVSIILGKFYIYNDRSSELTFCNTFFQLCLFRRNQCKLEFLLNDLGFKLYSRNGVELVIYQNDTI